jgi:signal transduction histidine kinase
MARWTLRRRIVWTYTALTVAVCALFAALIYLTVKDVEDRLVYRRLHAHADLFLERYRRGETHPVKDIEFFHGSSAPAEFAALPHGVYDKTRNGRDVHVLVREDGAQKLVVVDEEQSFWLIERDMNIALAAGVFASLLLALLIARLTVNRVVAPLTALAQAVQDQEHAHALASLDTGDEVGTLARAFAQRAGTLEDYLVRERSFTGHVSHELRTPLTVISGAAEVLASHAEKHAALLPLAQRIGRAAADATERVNALLLLARTAQQVEPVRTDLAPIVRREAERCRALLAAKPVVLNLRIEDSVQAIARPELVGILVGNLLRNACQYTNQGAITLTLASGALIVDDTGPGLPPPVRERLFERLVQGAASEGGGTGIGLSIVRRISEHLHWSLQIEDRRGGGTRISLAIPSPQTA